MAGFVGVQARRRKRNRIFIITFFIIILLSIFYLPFIDFSNQENQIVIDVLPDNVEDEKSLASEIEDLKLKVFQKDQRIKFRDGQINDLKEKNLILNDSLKKLENEYQKTLGNFTQLESNTSQNSEENKNEIKILENKIKELSNIIKNYEIEISKLKKDIKNSTSIEELEKINIQNSILKNEINLAKREFLEAEKNIDDLKLSLSKKQLEIDQLKYLKDLQHHQ